MRLKPKISIRIICYVAMLIALTFVLERLIPIVNLPNFRVTLAFIPMMCCGMLFGPIWGALAYGIADILGWSIMSLTPIPLILVSRVMSGFIFGIVLYRENVKFAPHAIISACLELILCGAGLSTLGLSLFFGRPFFPELVFRLPQLAVIFALQLAVFPILVRFREALRDQLRISS